LDATAGWAHDGIPTRPPPKAAAEKRGSTVSTPTLHTYRAAETGLRVNSYLIEGDSGVLVIDSNLLVSDIEAMRVRLAALHKPLLGIAVTHAHPDHFNGLLALVRDHEVPVFAAPSVARTIEEVADAKRAQWSPTYGSEWPSETYYPNTLLADGDEVRLGELSLSVRELGAAESHADSYVVVSSDEGRPLAFIGDLAFNGTHSYMADGHTSVWLAVLDTLAVELADTPLLYPGHGDPTGPDVLADQRRYLAYYREVVQRLADGEPRLSDPAKVELERAMEAFLPDGSLRWMIGLGADAVAAELCGPAAVTPV
jgi:glyoxylase-like metal-dependent hydrolase (beta-lactamase superfamily II)